MEETSRQEDENLEERKKFSIISEKREKHQNHETRMVCYKEKKRRGD